MGGKAGLGSETDGGMALTCEVLVAAACSGKALVGRKAADRRSSSIAVRSCR